MEGVAVLVAVKATPFVCRIGAGGVIFGGMGAAKTRLLKPMSISTADAIAPDNRARRRID